MRADRLVFSKKRMPFVSRKIAFLLGLLISGCGGSGESGLETGPTQGTGSTTSLTGKVTSEGGAPIGGVRVVVHERISNAKFIGESADDGSFTLYVPAGVYDLGLDKENDSTTATCFYGPLDTAGTLPSTYILRSSGGRSADRVFGKLWLQPGNPAPSRKLTLVADHGHGRRRRPANVTARTQADGSFELTLPVTDELGLNLEIYDGSELLDEFVDFGKLEKPAYLELASEQSPVENVLRIGQTLPTGAAGPADNVGGEVHNFNFNESQRRGFVMDNGRIPVDNTTRKVYDLLQNPDYGATNLFKLGPQPSQIRLASDGFWFWRYAIHVGYLPSGQYYFTDESPDIYSLWISSGTIFPLDWHKVSFNSKAPRIVRIEKEDDSDDNSSDS